MPAAHCVVPAVQALLQHPPLPAAPLHAPPVHGVMAALKMQPRLSVEQVARTDVLWHVGPAVAPHVGSVLHEQVALPDAPVQLWLVPQLTGVPYDEHPLLPRVQVARPPLMQAFCPVVQLFVHVRAHEALVPLAEHTCGELHVIVDATNGHEFVSTEHVATVWPSWHTEPAAVQMDGEQVQAATPADTVQAWCVPHVFVVVQPVHPFDCTWQVWTAPDRHWVAPAVHALVQQAAEPAAPVHAPPVQGPVADSKSHPSVSCEQVARTEALAHVGPVPAHTGSWLQVHLPAPLAPVQL